jgi:ribosomal protein S6
MAMAIAEHNPSKLAKKNRGMLKMSQAQLHDFAATPQKKLAMRISKSRAGSDSDYD